jgi:tetratricopeptide (TPR) repeat protein
VRYLAAPVLAGITCAGWFAFGEAIAPAAPGDDTNQVQAGTLNAQAEKTSEASALYASALSRDAAGDHAGALDDLRHVAALDPTFTDAQLKLASLLLDAGQPDAALAQLLTAQSNHADPNAVNALMAQIDAARGQTGDARKLAEAALAHDSGSTDAMRVLLQLGVTQKDIGSAVGRVTERLEAAKAPTDSYLALVKIYLELTGKENPQPDGGIVLKTLLGIYQVAAKQGTPTVDLLSVLSDTYNQLGQQDDALKTLVQAVKLDPQNVDLIMRCAALASETGDKDEERRDYEQAYALEPQREGLRASLAGAYFENQEYQKSFDLMKEMLNETPDDSMLLIRLAVTSETLQHSKEESQTYFKQAIHSPALTLEAALKLCAFFIDQQRGKEAGDALATAVKRFPTSPDLNFYCAVQKLNSGDSAAALDQFNRARKLAGDDPSSMGVNFYLEGSMILAAAPGHQDEVDPFLQDGLQRYPDDPNLLNQRAWEWAEQKHHLDDAVMTAKKAISLAPDNGSMLDTLGYVYLKMDKSADALPVLQQAANLTNNDPSVCQHLGDAYLAQGRKAEALAAWRLGLKKEPGNRDLNQRIEHNQTSAPHASSSSASS